MSNIISKMLSKAMRNRGVLRKSGDMHFINLNEIMRVFLSLFYKDEIVVILYECNKMCEVIPKLQILKRDNWGAYYWAKHNDLVIIKFESVAKAEDWVFSISRNTLAKWEIYNRTILIRNELGIVKPKKEEVTEEYNG